MNGFKSLTLSLFGILLLQSSVMQAAQPHVTHPQPTVASAQPSLISRGFDMATLLAHGYSLAGKSLYGTLPAVFVISKIRPNLKDYPLLQMFIPEHKPQASDPAYEKFIGLTQLLISINKDKILPMIPELFKKYVASEGRIAGTLEYLTPGSGPSFFTTFADSGLKQAALQTYNSLPDTLKRAAVQAIVIGLIVTSAGYLMRKFGSTTGMLASPSQDMTTPIQLSPAQITNPPVNMATKSMAITPTQKVQPISSTPPIQSSPAQIANPPMAIIPTQKVQPISSTPPTNLPNKPSIPSSTRPTKPTPTRSRSSNTRPWYIQQRIGRQR